MRVVCWGSLREIGSSASSKGSSIQELTEFVNGNPVDLSIVSSGWEDQVDMCESGGPERAQRVLRELYETYQVALGQCTMSMESEEVHARFLEKFDSRAGRGGNVEVLIVSHAGFLDLLMGINPYETEKSGK
jgi:hypothetical protein